MKITRYFTQEDTHPFDTISWKTTDAVIKNPDGTIHFQQQNVEAPEFWSQRAIDIVSNKYFYGKMHTDERETSIKQLIKRVVNTIVNEGEKQGYFTSEEGFTFAAELTDILVNQRASFNSPVWFNCGTIPGKVGQSSACFINGIEDTIPSIADFVKTEAIIFKYGSGSGVNISSLRSKQEHVTGGGKASGPVSFMRLHDANAGTVKSGGKTRRAAKLVCMNVDHPDIMDFIYCKGSEEKKAKILADNGYTFEEASNSVAFQNANHSIRVTDEFMNAVIQNKKYQTKFVTTSEQADTYKAKDVLRSIAEETWRCGDPGIQFHDQFNAWHTCPKDGEQVSTNPCVTGDTLITTHKGLVRIDSIVNKHDTTLVKSFDNELYKPTRIIYTGIKPVYKLTTKKGYSVKLTNDHKVYTLNRGDVSAYELTKDDRIILVPGEFGKDSCGEDLAQIIGLGIGDGCISNNVFTLTMGHDEENIVELAAQTINSLKQTNHDIDSQTRHTDTGYRVSTSVHNVIDLLQTYAILDLGSERKQFTDRVFTLNKSCQKAILQGLFTADGTVANYSDKSQYVALDSTSQVLLEQVQTLLLNFGIISKLYKNRRAGRTAAMLPDGKGGLKQYDVKEMHSLRISKSSRLRFEDLIGFMSESHKSEKLYELNRTVSAYKDKPHDTVESLEYIRNEKVYDITEPETSHFIANGIAVHNCSEYTFVNDTSCNLSSMNLLKFFIDNNTFDIDGFCHTIRIMFIAQDILVKSSTYPTEKIKEGTLKYHNIGLGYTNLGSYLMHCGLPYDSDEGRHIAASITALMTAQAYNTSVELSSELGSYPRYEDNKAEHIHVMMKHQHATVDLMAKQTNTIINTAINIWDSTIENGEKYGYRNAQATVLAPTGTISFMMDCDTTGIEPELSLVKYKKLSEGGQLTLVNQSITRSLENLDYTEHDIDRIKAYITAHNSLAHCDVLQDTHLPIFDCSYRDSEGRMIDYHAHVNILAAVQPFLSGSISKTVNVPEETTIEQIMDLYTDAWQKGLKCIAIYRDGSKVWQPLNTTSTSTSKHTIDIPKYTSPVRMKLSQTRQAITHKFSIGGHEGYITIGLYDNGTPGEVFIVMNKEGSTISGLMDGFATSISMALQYGVPLSKLCEKFEHTRFEPSGFTGNKDVPIAKSILDYIFRWMHVQFIADEKPITNGSISHTIEEKHTTPVHHSDAPACSSCGNMMVRQGTCYYCTECGTTSGCS